MHKIGHSKGTVYTVLDNKEAFYSLPLAEESRDLTAVSSSKFHCRYTRMPLGLKVASSLYHRMVFQEMMRDCRRYSSFLDKNKGPIEGYARAVRKSEWGDKITSYGMFDENRYCGMRVYMQQSMYSQFWN
jgi:hypothetical protein